MDYLPIPLCHLVLYNRHTNNNSMKDSLMLTIRINTHSVALSILALWATVSSAQPSSCIPEKSTSILGVALRCTSSSQFHAALLAKGAKVEVETDTVSSFDTSKVLAGSIRMITATDAKGRLAVAQYMVHKYELPTFIAMLQDKYGFSDVARSVDSEGATILYSKRLPDGVIVTLSDSATQNVGFLQYAVPGRKVAERDKSRELRNTPY